jgi:hypothetical protein
MPTVRGFTANMGMADNNVGMDRRRYRFVVRCTAGMAAMLSLAACATGPEGVFEPACIAHAGDRVELSDGRFEWNRFTDEVSVDATGNRIDPFPGYPKSGRFEVDAERLSWVADDGAPLDDRYLVKHRGRTWLLTYEQSEAVLGGEDMPACALVMADPSR